jgi:hypothetical protein
LETNHNAACQSGLPSRHRFELMSGTSDKALTILTGYLHFQTRRHDCLAAPCGCFASAHVSARGELPFLRGNMAVRGWPYCCTEWATAVGRAFPLIVFEEAAAEPLLRLRTYWFRAFIGLACLEKWSERRDLNPRPPVPQRERAGFSGRTRRNFRASFFLLLSGCYLNFAEHAPISLRAKFCYL